jgi:hypothetical protein
VAGDVADNWAATPSIAKRKDGVGAASNFDEGSASRPPPDHWPPAHSSFPASRPRTGLAIAIAALALAAIATLAAAASLVVVLTRHADSGSRSTNATPSHPPAEVAAAQRQLCGTYKLVAHAPQVDTTGGDKALAPIATTNGAVMLNMTAPNPALDPEHRDAARALATAYGTLTAKGSYGVATDSQYHAALDDAIAKDAAMEKVCGGS